MSQAVPWGQIIAAYMPAVVILATVTLGIIANNKRIDDLDKRSGDRFHGLERYMDVRFKGMEDRLDKVETKLDKVETRLGQVEGRLDKIDGRLERVDGRLDRIGDRLEHPIVVK